MFTYRPSYYLTHPHKFIRELYYTIKWFIQRGYRGWADCDIWSLDLYLCEWLPDALRKLSGDVRGVPADMVSNEDKDFNNDLETWKSEIRRMAEGFEAKERIANLEYPYGSPEYKTDEQKANVGMMLFMKRFDNLGD